jgi:integrase/recombinase XerD
MQPATVLQSINEFSAYLGKRVGVSDRTVRAYAADVRSFARFLAYDLQNQATPATPQHHELPDRFVEWLRSHPKNSPATIRRKLVSLKVYCRWRMQLGHLEQSPFEQTTIIVRLPKRLPRALSRVDALQLAGGIPAQGHRPDETRIALRLLLATGLRISEMCSINVTDVATDCSAICINGKGERERVVFVTNPALQREIAQLAARRLAHAGPSAPLFLNRRSSRLTPQAFRLRLHRIAADIGLPTRVTPHRLRHTAATLLLEEGVDIRFVQKLLGHASIATTEIYTKVADASLKAALTRADPLRHLQR